MPAQIIAFPAAGHSKRSAGPQPDAPEMTAAATWTARPSASAEELVVHHDRLRDAYEETLKLVVNHGNGEIPGRASIRHASIRHARWTFFRRCLDAGVRGPVVIAAMRICGYAEGRILSTFRGGDQYHTAVLALFARGMPGASDRR